MSYNQHFLAFYYSLKYINFYLNELKFILMLNNFNLIKSCFGPDDEDDEKFEIKRKKE